MLLKLFHVCIWLWEWLIYVLPAISNLILVLLGVVMSLPKLAEAIEETPKYRKLLAAICLIAGFVGFAFDVSQRRTSDQTNHQLLEDVKKSVDTLKDVAEKTNRAVDNTNSLVTSSSLEWAQLTSLNANISGLNIKIEGARGNAKLLARLQGEADAAKKRAAQSTERILATTVPQSIEEMRRLYSTFNEKIVSLYREQLDERMGGRLPSQEAITQDYKDRAHEAKLLRDEYESHMQVLVRTAV
jgi:phosphoribosylanthranilate isomerase